LLRRIRGVRGSWSVEEDEDRLVRLWKTIREQEVKLEILKKASGGGGVAERVVKVEEEVLERLREEYELLQLRLISYKRIESLGDDKLKKLVARFLSGLEKGENVTSEQHKILKRLEELWRREAMELSVLEKMGEGGKRA
jgi:Ran GTPase-activating protein (RanGAP) involved in mRNA processing and transport